MAPNMLPESRVTPAQLSFLSIYSPALGPTDETFRDQIVFYYSRAQKEARNASKKGTTPKATEHDLREEENERLRQIGLAQGMVGFAQSFSDGQNVDSVETEKSRIVLYELEPGWWILASIDLTRLPASSIASKGAAGEEGVEYSAREVSPPSLLIEQLLTAHRIFLLHHGPSLQDLFQKIKRARFCGIVERYWASFCKDWEVLLHGNPSVDIFGGIKLSAGGELGMGVGEEEWGSGERAVLEDLTRQTEGLVDLTVSRFGKAESERQQQETEEQRSERENTELPWLGIVRAPEAHDGVIFGGVGALSRHSLRDVSNWVAQIYSQGEHAYGVKDNPHSTRRKRQRRNLPSADSEVEMPVSSSGGGLRKQIHKPDLPNLPHDPRPALHERVASNDHAPGSPSIENPAPLEANMRAGIPRPIVSAVESSLDKASFDAQNTQPPATNSEEANGWTFGISNDRWVKYLTLGLGGGKSASDDASTKSRPSASRATSATSSRTLRPQDFDQKSRISKDSDVPQLQQMEPMPDGHETEAHLADQRRQETEGYFLIGLKGDLSKTPAVDSPVDEPLDEGGGDRLLLRTVQVEIVKKHNYQKQVDKDVGRLDSQSDSDEDTELSGFRRLRVVVYVRRPFIYTFLFEQRAPPLQISSFYKDIHQHLKPLHKTLQSSTAIANIARRIADSHTSPPEPTSIDSSNPPYQAPRTSPVFDLVYDPIRLTIHTSIPNIPLPGTPAAEGISTTSSGRDGPPSWTRIEGLNVHNQILSTLDSTKRLENELERTSKTSRGWWVVWMRIPPYADDENKESNKDDDPAPGNQYGAIGCKVAFLVRRASDWYQTRNGGSSSGMFSGSRVASGMFGGGGRKEPGLGGSDATGWGPASLASGIGIDARKYVEGLLSLNR